VAQEDLAGRFRLPDADLALLRGSQLCLQDPQVLVKLASVWQERELSLTTKSAIELALRQRLGPGYIIEFGCEG
jgi:hypothetical protein